MHLPMDRVILPYLRLNCLVRRISRRVDLLRQENGESDCQRRRRWKPSTVIVFSQHLHLVGASGSQTSVFPLPADRSSVQSRAAMLSSEDEATRMANREALVLDLDDGVTLALQTVNEREWGDLIACLGPVCTRLSTQS